MLPSFIIKHVSGGKLHFLLFQKLPLAENEVDVVVGHRLIMVERRDTLNIIGLSELLSEEAEQQLPVKILK